MNGTPISTSSGRIARRWCPPTKSNAPDISRSRAAATVAGGYGSVAPIDSCRPTIVTGRPAASSASATEIASNVPVSSYTTAGPASVARPPKPNTSHDVNTCGRSYPGTGVTGVESWKPSRRGDVPVARITSSGSSSATTSGSTIVLSRIVTPSRSTSLVSHSVIAPMSLRCGAVAAIAT